MIRTQCGLMGRAPWLALDSATILFVIALAACGGTTGPADPGVPKVAEGTYALTSMDGKALPFLVYDRTPPDGSRSAHWIVADTIRFLADGSLTYLKVNRWLDQNPGEPEDVYEDMTMAGGFFEQTDDRVAVAWHYLERPTAEFFTDTLQVRAKDLVRRMELFVCAGCPRPVVELVYGRVKE